MSGPELETVLEFAREAVAWNLDGIPEVGSTKMHMRQIQLVASALLSLAAQSEELRAELERAENECRALVSARDNCEQQFQEQVNKTLAALESRRILESRYSALVTAGREMFDACQAEGMNLEIRGGPKDGHKVSRAMQAFQELRALLDSEASDQGGTDG